MSTNTSRKVMQKWQKGELERADQRVTAVSQYFLHYHSICKLKMNIWLLNLWMLNTVPCFNCCNICAFCTKCWSHCRDLKARTKASWKAALPGFPLARSSFQPSPRMRLPSPSRWPWEAPPTPQMARTPPTAPFTWNTPCWRSCKLPWQCVRNDFYFICVLNWFACHVTCSTLVIKQRLPGIYVQPSYKSALSKYEQKACL